jgi:SAM-dependent methyltransferase
MTTTLDPVCPCCGAALNGKVLFIGRDRWQGTPGEFDVTECGDCGAGVTLPRLPNDQLGDFYPESYAPYVPVEGRGPSAVIWGFLQKRALAGPPLNALAERAPGRVVDVGCGRGDLAAQLIARGWTATGVEPSPGACEVAKARGVDCRLGTLDTIELEPGAYDAAVFQHSLEHVTDATTDLRRIRDALAPGGIAVVILPNFGSWQRKRFGSRWFHLDVPRHRIHFTPGSLDRAMKRAGLSVERIGTSSSAVGLPGTIQYVIAGRCVFPSGLPRRLAMGFAYLLSPLSRLLDRLGGGGDFVWAIARPDVRTQPPACAEA